MLLILLCICWSQERLVNTLRLEQNGLCFEGDILKGIFLKGKFDVLTKISGKFVCMDPIDNQSEIVQVMAWCQISAKPLSRPMMLLFTNGYMSQCHNELTPKQLEMHGCISNTAATDALVLKHQAISIHSAD